MKKPNRVIIVGGTHGNEWTGIQIVQHYQEELKSKFPNLKLEFIFANPEAHKQNSRFKDEDLNRAFEHLHDSRHTYEHLRAHEIKKIIDREPCLVLDLHTTTAAMGKTIIVSHYNSLNLSLCSKLKLEFKDCHVIGSPDPKLKYLASQSTFGIILEVGPVANSVVDGLALESTLSLINCILAEMSTHEVSPNGSVELFEETQDVPYPKNEKGQLNAYIHSSFQGKDFQAIRGKFTPFRSFQSEDIQMETKEELFPIFINEAAYYAQNLAFTLCHKKKMIF